MNLNQLAKKERYKQKRMAINEAKEEALAKMTKMIDSGLSTQMELVMLLVLHDKFGFGAERCARAVEAWEDLWDSYARQHLDLEDIADVVRDELHLEIEDDMIYKLGKNGERIPFKGR